uniref:Uncharacterized protein n=1 Tax=Chromera velia CCMP2878 TaxID=1169474 RepID=A0A0G4I7V9_9ALVE|eukprot:Cvel_11698.t1-p1 / transcript=Cvel_11698.t1 / gene=Cvel_11698 / organism=Chromera_velia_CCMP2878 / gene_product=Serine/threonine-protein phosphatase 6 regulatory, putative / transcript_product=Serine/threonine-protein phosphatase 6 regulatory, putative / location=Cvel_scaffold742:16738-17818(+) / protein_length=329 / sequence_SO=supercontig / SO=protein_coding / is_pseudo=false
MKKCSRTTVDLQPRLACKSVEFLDVFTENDVGTVLRSFQAFSAETLRKAVVVFLEQGEREDLEFVLLVGADWDGVAGKEKETALYRAVKAGNFEVVKLLVDAGSNVGVKCGVFDRTAFHLACNKRPESLSMEIVKLLVSSGADVNLADSFAHTPLMLSATHNTVDLAKLLLSRVAVLLLERGARIDAQNHFGKSPLFCTCMGDGNPEMTELLLSRGGNINVRDAEGKTALMEAAYFGAEKTAAVLVRHATASDLNVTDKRGYTALHYTIWEPGPGPLDDFRVAKVLVDGGINVHARGRDGRTAAQLAKKQLPHYAERRMYLERVTPGLR